MEPDFNDALFVDANKILCNMEIAKLIVENFESSECPGEDIEVLGVGDSLNIGNPQREMINVDLEVDKQGT